PPTSWRRGSWCRGASPARTDARCRGAPPARTTARPRSPEAPRPTEARGSAPLRRAARARACAAGRPSGGLGHEPADVALALAERGRRGAADLVDRHRRKARVPVVERGRRTGREETPPAPGPPGDSVGRERRRAQKLAANARELILRHRSVRDARELVEDHLLDAVVRDAGPERRPHHE